MHQRFTYAIAILSLISSGVACSLLRPNGPPLWRITLEIDAAAAEKEAATKQAVSVIEQRLDEAGVHNFKVIAQGSPSNGRILVSFPDVPDRERWIKLITAAGQLELSAIVSPPSPSPVQTYNTKEDAIASLGGRVPDDRSTLPYAERNVEQDSVPGKQSTNWVVVQRPAIVDGSDLQNAAASRNGGDDYVIAFSLKPTGAEKLGAWTSAHINDYLGVVLNGEVKSIAFIKSQISDQGEIRGGFSKQSAEDLALVLRSGALPAPLKIVEQGIDK